MTLLQQERTPSQQLGMFFVIWMGCLFLFTLLTEGFLFAFSGTETFQAFANGTGFSERDLQIARYLQILLSIGIFGVPPLLLILISKPRNWSFFKLNRVPSIQLFPLTILIVGLSFPLILWALDLNQNIKLPDALQELERYLRDLEEKNEQFLQAMLTMNTHWDFAVNFLMIALVPAFVEEFIFRGTLQQLLQKVTGPHIAIILSGAFFSFIHMEFFGFFPRMMLGILFGYLFFWSRSLWVSILAHFLHNGTQVVMVYLYQHQKISVDIDKIDSPPPYITMIGTALLFVTLYIFDYTAQKQAPKDGEGLGENILNQ